MEDRTSLWNNPFFKALRGFAYFIIGYLALWLFLYFAPEYFFANKVNYALDQLTDVFLCVAGLVVWLVFFAQFVLPVRTFRDRLKVVDRLVTYIMGGHGAALFVENGIVRAREGEAARKGAGVIWLDSASAAVLRTATQFTRTVGPGVHFTAYDEYIAATADLHPLSQTVGAADSDSGDLDPFKVTKEKAPDDFEAIQKRRWETSAMTRDGIEVVATISVTFRISAKEGEGNSRFGFNAENAEKAIRDSITRGAALDQPVWSELPAKMVVDVWREYLRKFKLSELFDIPDYRTETGLQSINTMVGKRLKQKEVEQFDDFGRPVLKFAEECQALFDKHRSDNRYKDIEKELNPLIVADDFSWYGLYTFLIKNKHDKDAAEFLVKKESLEFKTLSNMGLEVSGAAIKRVLFAPDIEERIMSQWTTLWSKNAQKERDQVDRDRKLAETQGQEDAIKEYALEASREIAHPEMGRPNGKFHALEMLVHSTFLGVRRNSALLKRTDTEQRDLSEIFSWLRDKRE